MFDNEKFAEVGKKRIIIAQLQEEIGLIETELRKTFADDVHQFFLAKGYEFIVEGKKESWEGYEFFDNLRQVDEKNTFYSGCEPRYYIAGINKLAVKFEWHLIKNIGYSNVIWYPEKQTLDDFFNRRLKKILILSIKTERKNKINNIINSNQE